jgi:AcrR family transcriptional regulator
MSREQAADYEDKKQAIMDVAAGLFARVGYPNAKLQDVAQACGASKSMLYHYFPAKDDLLFSLLSEHLQRTIAAIEQIDDDQTPETRFRILVEVYTQKSTQNRTRHIVAMNDIKYLPKPQQKPLLELQRRLLRLFEAMVAALDPELAPELVGPYSMLLIGMLNWTDLWYRPAGPLKPTELCDRIAQLFLHGFLANRTVPAFDMAEMLPVS